MKSMFFIMIGLIFAADAHAGAVLSDQTTKEVCSAMAESDCPTGLAYFHQQDATSGSCVCIEKTSIVGKKRKRKRKSSDGNISLYNCPPVGTREACN